VAALHAQVAVVQVLLDAGADVNVRNNYAPYTPDDINKLFYTNNGATSSNSTANGNGNGMGASVSVNGNQQDPIVLLNIQGLTQSGGYTPLQLAVFTIKHKQLLEMLVAKGADVNAQGASGATALFFAALRGQKDDVQFLLDHGANVNLPDAYGNTPLDCVLHRGYETFVSLLVDKGADVNALDQSQHRPLTYARQVDLSKAIDILRKHGAHE
jgi:ankyrin repeat protein